jgi:carbon monoxide dehydrogenase subunit G
VKLQGSYVLPGSREQVWELFTDPARLAKLLPGCERLEPDGPDRYKVAVKFGVAAITGKYAGSVELSDKHPPASLGMRVEGKGAPGFMKGEGKLELVEKRGQTEVRYTGEAQVGGVIASVGQRMIEAAARKIIQQFFESAAGQLKAQEAKG